MYSRAQHTNLGKHKARQSDGKTDSTLEYLVGRLRVYKTIEIYVTRSYHLRYRVDVGQSHGEWNS